MIDIKLSRESGVLDMPVVNGAPLLVSGDDETQQRIDFKMNFFENDWFADLGFGIPYFGRVLQRGVNIDDLYGVYERAIVEEPGVERAEVKLTIDPQIRVLRVSATVVLSSGAERLIDTTEAA